MHMLCCLYLNCRWVGGSLVAVFRRMQSMIITTVRVPHLSCPYLVQIAVGVPRATMFGIGNSLS